MLLRSLKNTGNGLLVMLFALGLFFNSSICLGQQPGEQEKTAYSHETKQWYVHATSPGVKILSASYHAPGRVLSQEKNPKDAAQDWLIENELEEGRNLLNKKLLYVSIGSASVNANPSEPKFIDSRYLAFQRAELEAKAKTAIFLGVDLTTTRGTSEREINPYERAALEEIVKASPTLQKNAGQMGVKENIYGLFKKAHRLTEAKMDKALENEGVDLASEQAEADRKKAEAKAKRDRFGQLRNISEASLKAAASAFAEVQGTQVIQSFEASYKGNYQVVVITLWSQNLQRLVESMQRGTAPMELSIKKAKKEVTRQLPEDPNELACLTGVRAYINQDGEHVLLAFGQAGVEVLGGREDKAFELAGKKARLRAMAAMRTFMGEKIAFSATEELAEVLALYANEYQEGESGQDYRSISQFQENIQAISKKQKIAGIHGLLTRELTHPFTDKPVVLKVMSWSPSSQSMSKELKQSIEYGVKTPVKPKAAEQTQVPTPARKGIISSGEGADKDAW